MKLFLFTLFLTPLLLATESFSGSVVSQNILKLSSRYMGYIKEVNVNEGDFIKRGKLLYRIDSQEVDNLKEQILFSQEQATMSKQMYQNQYNQAALVLQRYKRLYDKKMIAKIEVENAQLQVNNLKAILNISKKQIKKIKIRLKDIEHSYNYLNIVSPINGVVIKKSINQGDISIPAIPALTIADLEQLLIEVDIPESVISSLKIGMSVDIKIPSINYVGSGTIKNIIPFSDSSAHRFKIKIIFNHKDLSVYPGMYSKITFKDSNQ